MVVVSHLFLLFMKKVSGSDLTHVSQICPCLELSISRQPLSQYRCFTISERNTVLLCLPVVNRDIFFVSVRINWHWTATVVVKHFCNTCGWQNIITPLCCRPRFIWSSITIKGVGAHMIIINICEFLYSLIKCFFRSEFIQICALIFQCVEITLHRCVVIWGTCLAHALRHIYGFTEFDKCFRRILCSPVRMQDYPFFDRWL